VVCVRRGCRMCLVGSKDGGRAPAQSNKEAEALPPNPTSRFAHRQAAWISPEKQSSDYMPKKTFLKACRLSPHFTELATPPQNVRGSVLGVQGISSLRHQLYDCVVTITVKTDMRHRADELYRSRPLAGRIGAACRSRDYRAGNIQARGSFTSAILGMTRPRAIITGRTPRMKKIVGQELMRQVRKMHYHRTMTRGTPELQ